MTTLEIHLPKLHSGQKRVNVFALGVQLPYARAGWRTIADSQWRYSMDYHLCDEQSHQAADNAQCVAPSLIDAPGYISIRFLHSNLRDMDDHQAQRPEYSHLSESFCHPSTRRPSPYASHTSGSLRQIYASHTSGSFRRIHHGDTLGSRRSCFVRSSRNSLNNIAVIARGIPRMSHHRQHTADCGLFADQGHNSATNSIASAPMEMSGMAGHSSGRYV